MTLTNIQNFMKNNINPDKVQQILAIENKLQSEHWENVSKSNHFHNGEDQTTDTLLKKLRLLYVSVLRDLNVDLQKRLSAREVEIIKLICNGNTTDEIAKRLNLSKHTVESHRANIFSKLDVRNSTELVAKAFRVGLVE